MGQTPLSRDEFDFDPDLLTVSHCADGPMPSSAVAAGAEALRAKGRPWTLDWQRDMVGIPERLKGEAARLLDVRSADISLTTNTSTGLSTLAQAYPWREGDEVLLPMGEFPSNYWPWRSLAARGVSVRQIPLWPGQGAGDEAWTSSAPPADVDPEARLLAALRPTTRILAVSWVRFQDGVRLDLPRLARGCGEAGVHLVVDGIQGAGTVPAELDGVSAFVTGGHKGLLGPHGQGFVWTEEAFRLTLAPPGGWLSVEEAGNFARPGTDFERTWAEDASRLDSGLPNLAGSAALTESLHLLNGPGTRSISTHIAGLQRRLLGALIDHPRVGAEAVRLLALLENDRLGSILALHHQGGGARRLLNLSRAASETGIHATLREGYFRIALHGWHSRADADLLADWLASSW